MVPDHCKSSIAWVLFFRVSNGLMPNIKASNSIVEEGCVCVMGSVEGGGGDEVNFIAVIGVHKLNMSDTEKVDTPNPFCQS